MSLDMSIEAIRQRAKDSRPITKKVDLDREFLLVELGKLRKKHELCIASWKREEKFWIHHEKSFLIEIDNLRDEVKRLCKITEEEGVLYHEDQIWVKI